MSQWFEKALGNKSENELIAIKHPKVNTVVEGKSGIRRIKIQEHQIIADSLPEWIGYNLRPSAPEILLVL